MSFLKKIAGAFVEVTDDKPPVKKSVPTAFKGPTTISMQPSDPVSYGYVVTADVAEFRDQFNKILEDENTRNFPGNDYYEFVAMKNAMSGIPQESIKYQAAYAGWKIGGSQSKESLVSTATKYLSLVDREMKEFEDAYKIQYDQQVTGNEQSIAQKTAEVQKYAELIANLNGEIGDLKKANIDASSKLQTKHDAFTAAGQFKKQEILDEINKIKQYIN